MALVLKDRVKETTTSTGTGAVTLAGAAGPYQPFSTIGDGNSTYYAIASQANTEWEVGYGTYSLGTNSISRDVVLESSNAGALVNFSAGTKDIFVTYPAEKAIFEELNGETLINAGPITVVGSGVTSIPSLPAELGKFVGNVNSFAQIYTFNQNTGSEASADFVAYNDLTTDGYTHFTDTGINSSSYTSLAYPIFTPGSGYSFHDGDHYFIGAATANKNVVIFAGGVDVTDTVATFSGTDKSVSFVADVNVGADLDVTGNTTFGGTVTLNANPTLNLQAATKQYVDAAVSTGLHIHQPVRVERGSNLNATYNNGASGVGATLTNAGTQEALVIDGISVTVGDRVLVYGQTAAAQNGVYDVTDAGSGATNWVLTRSADANTYNPQDDQALGGGDYFFVREGLTGAGESYVCTNDGVITFGTTAITFTQFSASPTYVGGTNINVTGQTISLTGTVGPTNGGTGVNTVATGDLLYGSASNTWGKLAIGTPYRSLMVNAAGTQVEWNAVPLDQPNALSGKLGATYGGTGQDVYTLGDTLYSNATNSVARLAGNISTTKKYLSQTGTGSASAAPSWDALSASDILSGTLGVTYGGTGISSYVAGDIVYASGTTTLSALSAVATGNVLLSGGVGAAPSWGKVGLTTHVDGVLGVANGGTGTSTATGTGDLVLSNSPTLVTPALGAPQTGDFRYGSFFWPTFNQDTTGNAATATSANTAALADQANLAFEAQNLITTYNYQVNGLGVGTAASGTAGEIRATNNITAYYSDDRLKTNLGNIPNALDKLQTLNGFYYEANEVAQALGYEVKREVGVSAQQVQAIMPEVVAPAPIDETYLTVRYERLVPLLIEAIKELKAEVDLLKGK